MLQSASLRSLSYESLQMSFTPFDMPLHNITIACPKKLRFMLKLII